MAAGSQDWLAPLRAAYFAPWNIAEQWRARGGKVAGVLGWTVPRELIVAAGMLPIRLSALRVNAPGAPRPRPLPEGLAALLAPGPARVLQALLGGSLDWIDALVIGRDSEAHTKLFYVLRELTREGKRLPEIAFFDLLRLPNRTSARYNRLRARELGSTLARWAGRPVGPDEVRRALEEAAATSAALRRLAALRAEVPPRLAGSDSLVVCGAAQVLPGPQLRSALGGLPPDGGASREPGPRVYVTGSGQDDPWVYERLEEPGLAIVGEDHEWGPDVVPDPEPAPDPIDAVVDRYHLAPGAAARGSIEVRAGRAAWAARRLGADAVLQIIFEHDEAPGWELPRLRALLGGMPLLTVRLAYGERSPEALLESVAPLTEAVQHA